MRQMIHRDFIATAESLPVVVPGTGRDMRMTEFVAIVDVRGAVVVEVLAGSFNTIVEALTLDVAKLLRRRIPSISVLSETRR